VNERLPYNNIKNRTPSRRTRTLSAQL